MIELYFAPGACSFVPHVGLEAIKAATGEDFKPNLVKLHKGEHKTPEYLALNPARPGAGAGGRGQAAHQIVAICDYLDRRYPQGGAAARRLLGARAGALAARLVQQHRARTFTRWFRTADFAESEAAQADVKKAAAVKIPRPPRAHPGVEQGAPRPTGSATAFRSTTPTPSRCCAGAAIAGLDPDSLPAYKAYIERVMQAPPVAAALERERIALDTYKKAA